MNIYFEIKNLKKCVYEKSTHASITNFISLLLLQIWQLDRLDIVQLSFNPKGHDLLNIMVAFLVVSRVSTAYNRFWNTRTLLSKALCNCRQLSSLTAAFTNRDESPKAKIFRITLGKQIVNFIDKFLQVLQDDDFHSDKTISYMEESHVEKGIPVSIMDLANELYQLIVAQKSYLQPEHVISIQKEVILHKLIGEITKCVAELATYPATPYPFPKAQMSRILLMVWIFTLPFALHTNANNPYTTPIMMFFISYGFFGLEFVSIELDDPFGCDDNDLDIKELSGVIKAGILADSGLAMKHSQFLEMENSKSTKAVVNNYLTKIEEE